MAAGNTPSTQARIAALTSKNAATKNAAADLRASQKDKDRARIAFTLVIAFVALIVGVAAASLLGDWTKMKDPAEFVVKLLSSVLLPVVTLALGHYFGKSES